MADNDLKLPMHSRGWLALALAGIVACTAGSVFATSQWFGTPQHDLAAAASVAAPVHVQSRHDDEVMLARALRATALQPMLEARVPTVTTNATATSTELAPATRGSRRRSHSGRGHHARQARYESAPAFASVDANTLR